MRAPRTRDKKDRILFPVSSKGAGCRSQRVMEDRSHGIDIEVLTHVLDSFLGFTGRHPEIDITKISGSKATVIG